MIRQRDISKIWLVTYVPDFHGFNSMCVSQELFFKKIFQGLYIFPTKTNRFLKEKKKRYTCSYKLSPLIQWL